MKPVRPIKSTIIDTVVRSSLFIWIALLPGLFASGQVKFTTVVSSQDIGQKDYLQLEYVVENAKQIDELTPPNFAGFQVVQGPIQSSGMSIVNGAMSQYKGLSFVLQPVRTGKFTIGGASATVDGHPMRSNAVTINVHSGGGNSSGSGNGNGNSGMGGGNPFAQPFGTDPFGPAEPRDVDRDYVLHPGENVKEKIRKNLFLKVQVDKSSCFVGEPIVATYKLYTRVSSESRITKRPSLNGFSVYDMVDPASDPVSVEKLNGKAYTVHIIRKTQLIPLQAGNINLDPVEVENTVHFVKGGGHQERHGGSLQDLLDQMMDDNSYGPEIEENVTLDTKPVTIAVKPLPENKPVGFNGAVGDFSVETSLGNKTVAATDEMTLHVVVKGKGNIPMLTAPTVSWPAGFESFEPTAKEDVNKTMVPMSGSKSFDYVFTAKDPGHYTIPAVSLSYFDPSTQTYRSANGVPQDLQVTPAVRKSHSSPVTGTVAAAVAQPSLTDRVGRFVQDHLEWIFAVILISGVAVYFWRQNLRLKRTRGTDKEEKTDETAKTDAEKSATRTPPVGANRGNAPIAPWEAAQAAERERQAQEKAATPDTPGMASNSYVPEAPAVDPLQDARRLLEEGDPKGFYREVNRAIWKAIARKLNLPASELNKQNSVRQLQIRGWNESAVLSLENILSECEMNLYTPAYDRYNMQQLLRQSEWMLDRLA